MASNPRSGVRSTSLGKVSEMTHVARIKQGYTEPLLISPSDGGAEVHRPVRFVDNLRTTLAIVRDDVTAGTPTPLNDLATIHYARWVILPGDEYLLFTSNFDGIFEHYIHDFVSVANGQKATLDNPQQRPFMDMIWSNCVDYPGTTDFEAFLDWIRLNMVPTTLFFATLSSTTVRDVAWLRRFKALFEVFDAQADRIPREQWPVALRESYDALKSGMNRINVSSV